MVRMSDFEPFVYYRPKTIVRMPESTIGNTRKGVLYSILAPSVKSEITYLAENTNLQFRYVSNYFVEKVLLYKFHGGGQVKVSPNGDGQITELLQNSKFKARFKDINGVTSYKRNLKRSPLKGFNTIYEINHLTEAILTNEKDHRLAYEKFNELFLVWDGMLQSAPTAYGLTPDLYPTRVLLIPMDLWISPAEIVSNATYVKATKNPLGRWIFMLGNDPEAAMKMFAGYTVVLSYGDRYMKISGNLPANEKPDFLYKTVRSFLKRSIKAETISTYSEEDFQAVNSTPEEEETPEEKEKMTEVRVKSAKALEVDRLITTSQINPEKLTDEKREELERLVQVTISDDPAADGDDVVQASKLTDITDPKDVDIVIQAKMEGKSIENFKRDQMLKEKFKTIEFAGKTLDELTVEDEECKIQDIKPAIHAINPAYKNIRSHNFEKSYNEHLRDYDFANILLHFGSCKPALYLIKDPIIEDISDEMNKMYRVTVEYEDENRGRHKFSFKMPKWYQDKYLFINEQKWNIVHQKVPFPVAKTDQNMCQVSTNYNKIRMHRYGANISSKITKLIKTLGGPNCPSVVKVTKGNNLEVNKHYLTSLEYDELGSNFDQIRFGDTVIYFGVDDAHLVVGIAPQCIEDNSVFPIGISNKSKTKYFLSGMTNKVYSVTQGATTANEEGEFSDFLVNKISALVPKFKDDFDGTSAGTKFAYTRARIMDEHIPLVLVLCAADPGGLVSVMEKAKINYEFSTQRPSVDKDNQGIIPFSDGYLVFDRYPFENSLLMNGLAVIPTKEFSYYDMASRDTYVEIFDILVNRRNLIDGIENFYYLLIDPISHDILNRIGLPDTFTELMLYANGKLADNSFISDAYYQNSRIRSNEIINAYLYQALASAYASWKIGRSPKFSIPEDAIIKACLESRIVDSHSKLGMILEAENDRQVKLKGPGGMNEERSFTLEKRAYNNSMVGIIGLNTTPSGEVGINRHLTLNANIVDARGFIDIEKSEYNGTEMMTPGELMNVFGLESADAERVAMTISQSKHAVPVAKASPSLVSYDMERVLPYLSNDFAFKAKKDGKVIAIENDVMIIQYDDGTYDDVDLSEKADKNTDGGFYVMNQLTTDFKVGEKFKADEILARDSKYIGDRDELGDYSANIGTLARVAIVMNGTVYEDAGYMTDKLAHELASKITVHKNVLISKYANIKHMVKKGQAIQANEPMIVFDDTKDQFTSDLLASMADEVEDSDEIVASSAPVVAKTSGTIKDIKIYYTCPLEEMTPSLQKIIKDYNGQVSKRVKTLSKYIDPKDANTIIAPCRQVVPDSAGRVKGVKVGEGSEIIIEFYLEYLDIMGVGDKCSNYTALKMINSDIIPSEKAGFTEFDPERKVDAYLSAFGVYKRMCLDIIKVGGLTKILIEKKRLMRDKYLSRIEAELKK